MLEQVLKKQKYIIVNAFKRKIKRLNFFFQSAHKSIILLYLPLLSRAAGDQPCPACSYATYAHAHTHIEREWGCNRKKKTKWKISWKINMTNVKNKDKKIIAMLMKSQCSVIRSGGVVISSK